MSGANGLASERAIVGMGAGKCLERMPVGYAGNPATRAPRRVQNSRNRRVNP